MANSNYTIDEAVSAFSLLTVYLNRVGDAKLEKELCGALANAVGKAGGEHGEKQSAMVAALFNLRSDGNEKVALLTRIVELADESTLSPGQSRGVSALADLLDYESALKPSLVLWGDIDNVELRALYAAVSQGMDRVLAKLGNDADDKTTLAKIKAAKERKQTYMLLFLETYKEEVSYGHLSLLLSVLASYSGAMLPDTTFL